MMKTLLVTGIVVLSVECLTLDAQTEAPPAVFTEAQARAGKAAYESVCFNCHTYAVTGRKGNADELPAIDSLAEAYRNGIQQARGKIPALAGPEWVKRWGARTTRAFSLRIATAIGGFPPVGLDDSTANNLAAYFLQVSGARSGTHELGSPGTTEVLIGDLLSVPSPGR